MNKINFLEKKNVTYIIIAIFVIFGLIHLYKINSNTTEPFATIGENSNVANGVVIDIPSLTQVRFGIGSGNPIKDMSTLYSEKVNVTDLASALGSKADASALQLKADASALAVVSAAANNALAAANNAMPELSIIAFSGSSSLPKGWQLCDGSILQYVNTIENISANPVQERFINLTKKTITDFGDYYATPDLRGRFILGAGQGKVLQKDTNGNVIATKDAANLDISLTNRGIKDVGGVEKHKLTESEMPKHKHYIISPSAGVGYIGDNISNIYIAHAASWKNDNNYQLSNGEKIPDRGTSGNAGGDLPHENMPPFYVLTYIIKQPIKLPIPS